MSEPESWRAPAGKLIAQLWGDAVKIEDAEPLGGSNRSFVHRLRLMGGGGDVPGSVVVKAAGTNRDRVYDPDSKGGSANGLLNDWAGVVFLGELEPGPWLGFYGGNRENGVILIEDLGAEKQIDHVLLGEDADEARNVLSGYVRTLAELHGRSAGRVEKYEEIRQSLGPRTVNTFSGRVQSFSETMEKMGLGSDALKEEVSDCANTLEKSGPFLTYTHGDTCPDNCLIIGGRVYLLDFETANIRHALVDGVFPWIHFPSCWCVNKLPEDLPPQLMENYRKTLSEWIPEADDDILFGKGLVAA